MRSLDKKISATIRVALICVVCLLPASYIFRQFSPRTYFTGLIYYGSEYVVNAIPEVQDMRPAVTSRSGYDGQFYSQIAIHPSLKSPGMKEALDLPAYRAMRSFLPWLSYLAGLGRPFWIVQAYALSNLFFWYLLFFGMLHYLRPTTSRDYLCIFAACLSSGVMFSLERALVDLPAATLCFFGAFLRNEIAVAGIAAAVLTKETYVLQLVEISSRKQRHPHLALQIARYACVLIPLLLWYLYVHFTFGFTQFGRTNFGWPFSGYLATITHAITVLSQKDISPFSITALLAPISLLIQGFYLFSTAQPTSRYCRTGMAFALSSVFLSSEVFVEQVSYCRDLIPVSLAFNIALMEDKSRRFMLWFIGGNAGLTMGLLRIIAG
jgi:hypothetical protein